MQKGLTGSLLNSLSLQYGESFDRDSAYEFLLRQWDQMQQQAELERQQAELEKIKSEAEKETRDRR